MSLIIEKWEWAKQKPLFWLNITLVLLTVTLLRRPLPIVNDAPSDLSLRLWGMGLQLIGAFTVWKDLSSTARNFGKEGVIYGALKWLRVGFTFRKTSINLSAGACSGSSSSAALSIRQTVSSAATIQERLSALERNYQSMKDELSHAVREMNSQAAAVNARFNEQHALFTRKIDETHNKINDGLVGNYGMLLFGVCWLCFGIVFASVAPEFAKVLSGQWESIWLSL
jgi:hypothetical protein